MKGTFHSVTSRELIYQRLIYQLYDSVLICQPTSGRVWLFVVGIVAKAGDLQQKSKNVFDRLSKIKSKNAQGKTEKN
jgi:hypothetical protein